MSALLEPLLRSQNIELPNKLPTTIDVASSKCNER